ncbi:MAG: isoleucine--tRNA ligase, partial [Planctomycetota bacterium]|nr:isoleucine--tRNA ligase [Planctomycetota bacterium]
MDYSKTVNLPKTAFSMKANLREKEPKIQARWREMKLYEKIRKERKGAEKIVLHDGPPYATGDLHIGTVMNKVLKDFIVRYYTMCGKDSPYVPGWDCHGLPIEYKVMQSLGADYKKKRPEEIRKLCKEYAEKYVEYQKEQFCRFGVSGDWEHPYLTMTPEYESAVMDVFLRILENGYIYRQLRPIHWCYRCETALAEAELEYKTIEGPSIYVRFEAEDSIKEILNLDSPEPLYLLIWTTTPWTLPANVAVALGADFDYAAVKVGDEILLMAEKTVEKVMQDAGVSEWKIVGRCIGDEMEGMVYKHPFIDREGRIILGDFVSLEQGTGMVHIAPGHGKEDYEVGQKYGLDVVSPVDEQGRFTEDFKPQAGVLVFEADKRIIEDLRNRNALFASQRLSHSYPHCWRCGSPLIFRATKQWFISVEHGRLRQRLLEMIKKVRWVPTWGKTRITAMIEQRPDWCISRQRFWGVPIPALHCLGCGNILLDVNVTRRVKEVFAEEGADSWFKSPVERFLPEGFKCSTCGGTSFEKEKDILDVWFESGSSYCPVLMKKEEMQFPADIYLEGSDQHRGWFQSSLLTAVSTRGTAPYKTVLTHGFLVDEAGRKMSKSL